MTLTQITEKGIKDGEIVNADINASAAIAKSKLAALDIVNADINSSAAIAGTKISPDFGSQNIATTGTLSSGAISSTGNLTVSNTNPKLFFTDTNNDSDFALVNNGGVFRINDETNSLNRFSIASDGTTTVQQNLDVGAGTLHVDSTNNRIGINTTTPDRLIHAAGATPILKLDSTNNEAYVQLVTASPSNTFYLGLVDSDIILQSSGASSTTSENLRIKANGRVGINSASPSGTLSVADANGDNVTLVLHTSATTNYIQLSDSVNAHTYIGKENSGNLSQVAFYASTSTGNGTGKVAHFDYRGLVLRPGTGVIFNPHDNTGTDPYGSDSNHLDDYEKGSFQPAITSVNNPQPTQTAYVHQYGYYVKIGQMVHVRVDVEFSSTGVSGGTGEALLSNLPFSCQNETNAYGITMARGYAPNWYNNGCPTGGYMNPNSNFIYLMTNSSNGSTFSQGADIGGGTRLIAGFSYISN